MISYIKQTRIIQKILDILSKNPEGIQQSQLPNLLNISKSYLSIILKDLEKQGLVQRIKIGTTYIVKPLQIYHKPSGRILRMGIVWSSEYLFLGYFVKMVKDSMDIEIEVNIYPNAIQTITEMIKGNIDIALSPLITELYGYILSRNIIIAGGGASGGSYIYEISGSRKNVIVSSNVSTMDLCRYIAIKRRVIDVSDTNYFYSPSEAISIVKRGLAKYAVVWHPLSLYIEMLGARKVLECGDLEEIYHCCTLAISKSLGFEIIERLSSIYKISIERFLADPTRFLEWYSLKTNIDVSLLRKAVNLYRYNPEIDKRSLSLLLDTLSIEIPSRNEIMKAVL